MRIPWSMTWKILVVLAATLLYTLLLVTGTAQAACRAEPISPNTPTGIAGCVIYGDGTASQWSGPGVARNDCTWPWKNCQAIRITALETGRSVVVTPLMYCDCYTGMANQRIVDLDPITLAQLGLNPARGLHPVRVEPASGEVSLPDTAMH